MNPPLKPSSESSRRPTPQKSANVEMNRRDTSIGEHAGRPEAARLPKQQQTPHRSRRNQSGGGVGKPHGLRVVDLFRGLLACFSMSCLVDTGPCRANAPSPSIWVPWPASLGQLLFKRCHRRRRAARRYRVVCCIVPRFHHTTLDAWSRIHIDLAPNPEVADVTATS